MPNVGEVARVFGRRLALSPLLPNAQIRRGERGEWRCYIPLLLRGVQILGQHCGAGRWQELQKCDKSRKV